MVIVHLYTLFLCVFSNLYNSNCAMVEFPNKQYTAHTRTVRQTSRPILNGIIFLIATNLIAKGVLGLNAYSPPPTQNLQGSLYVHFGRPTQQSPIQAQPYSTYTQDALPYTFWNPVHNLIPYSSPSLTTQQPQPIHQHQIINIHEPPFESMSEDAHFQEVNGRPVQHTVIEKQVGKHVEPVTVLIPKRVINKKIIKKEENKKDSGEQFTVIKREADQKDGKPIKKQKVKPAVELFRLHPQQYNLINKLANFKRQVSKGNDKDIKNIKSKIDFDEVESIDTTLSSEPVTLARQMVTTTSQPVTTRASAATSASTSATTSSRAATTTPPMTMPTNTTGQNETGYNYGYGNYTGNENISITTMFPINSTDNATTINATNIYPGYYYYPSGEYGPSHGNENISITYSPPTYYNQNHQPFYPLPNDQYFYNHRRSEYDNQHYNNDDYNNYYQNQHNQHQNSVQQLNDAIQRFYNKYDYHYPGNYNN